MNNWKLSQFVETISKSRAHATFVLSASSRFTTMTHILQIYTFFIQNHMVKYEICRTCFLFSFSSSFYFVLDIFAHSQKPTITTTIKERHIFTPLNIYNYLVFLIILSRFIVIFSMAFYVKKLHSILNFAYSAEHMFGKFSDCEL